MFKVIKGLISPLLLFLELQNVKTAYSKLGPANLLQLTSLTFDPCFKREVGSSH